MDCGWSRSPRGQIVFIVIIGAVMVIFGTVNTLTAKWADISMAGGTNPKAEHYYDHPFFQTVTMFLGEALCFVAFKVWCFLTRCTGKDMSIFGDQKFNPLLWAIPAMCDLVAASIMYVALTLTNAASYQMLKGSVVIFTSLMSFTFLEHKFKRRHTVGILIVIIGLGVVGYEDYNYFYLLHPVAEKNTVLAGNLLVLLAQIITATQFTVEEKILRRHKIQPLQAVGWEGIFGFFPLAILLIPMYFIPYHLPQSSSSWQEKKRFEDTLDALYQWGYSWQILALSVGMVVSIAFFNFAGLTVTNEKNASARVVLDAGRNITIWVISLGIGWLKFEPYQPVGFCFIFLGIWIYYDSYFIPKFMKCTRNFIIKCTATQPEERPIFPLPPEVASA